MRLRYWKAKSNTQRHWHGVLAALYTVHMRWQRADLCLTRGHGICYCHVNRMGWEARRFGVWEDFVAEEFGRSSKAFARCKKLLQSKRTGALPQI